MSVLPLYVLFVEGNGVKDTPYLEIVLELAKNRRGFCFPNPSVGSLIVRDNTILATGYHLQAGAPHAERHALQKIAMQAPGATLYVTLEPCCHWGRTPPCTDAIIQSGISRVVYAYRDPNPVVSGQGELQLREAGILCEHISLPEIDHFYESYAHWLTTKRPFVTAKIAMSSDGKIAGVNGEPVRLTGPVADEFTHQHRKQSDAILTTVKTIIQDNPQLNARSNGSLHLSDLEKQACYLEQREGSLHLVQDDSMMRVSPKPLYILDRQLRLPLTARVLETAQSITLFHGPHIDIYQKEKLEAKDIRCIEVAETVDGLNLGDALDVIGQDGIHDLWVEAGGSCFSSFVKQSLLQRAFMYVAPRKLAEGQAAFPADFDLKAKKTDWSLLGEDALCEVRW